MMNHIQQQFSILLTILGLGFGVTFSHQSAQGVHAAEKKPAVDLHRLVLSRQKGEDLKVYLNSRGAYINGKSLSSDHLSAIVRKSGLKKATVTAESYITQSRMTEVKKLIQKAGIQKVKTEFLKPRNFKKEQEDQIRLVLSRQKGEELKVWLEPKAVYINGRSLSADALVTVVKKSGLKKVVITTEPSVSDERMTEIRKLIRQAGARNVQTRTQGQ